MTDHPGWTSFVAAIDIPEDDVLHGDAEAIAGDLLETTGYQYRNTANACCPECGYTAAAGAFVDDELNRSRTRRQLYVSSCGDLGRSLYDGAGKYLGDEPGPSSVNLPELAARLGRVPTSYDVDAEHDRLAREWLTADEIPAYEQWARMFKIFGEGTGSFTAADGTTWSFRMFLGNGLWLSWEPVRAVDDTEFWTAIDALVAEHDGRLEVMTEEVGLDSDPPVMDRQVDMNFPLDGKSDREARAMAQQIAERLAALYRTRENA
jgi:hypothetical protein